MVKIKSGNPVLWWPLFCNPWQNLVWHDFWGKDSFAVDYTHYTSQEIKKICIEVSQIGGGIFYFQCIQKPSAFGPEQSALHGPAGQYGLWKSLQYHLFCDKYLISTSVFPYIYGELFPPVCYCLFSKSCTGFWSPSIFSTWSLLLFHCLFSVVTVSKHFIPKGPKFVGKRWEILSIEGFVCEDCGIMQIFDCCMHHGPGLVLGQYPRRQCNTSFRWSLWDHDRLGII